MATKKAAIDKTNEDFFIHDTVFTTVTVNKNWQTAVHKDAGDLKGAFGNLVVLRAGNYTGGYFCLPQWKVAVDLNNSDILLVDVHQWHGNTPIHKVNANAVRLSLVMYYREKMMYYREKMMYYREKMMYCGSAEDELDIVKNRKIGTKLVNDKPKKK